MKINDKVSFNRGEIEPEKWESFVTFVISVKALVEAGLEVETAFRVISDAMNSHKKREKF